MPASSTIPAQNIPPKPENGFAREAGWVGAGGAVGSFTTFSTLVDESRGISEATSQGVAFAYLAGSLALGIAGFWLGERASALFPVVNAP